MDFVYSEKSIQIVQGEKIMKYGLDGTEQKEPKDNKPVYREERLKNAHKRNTKIKSVLIMFGCIAGMIVVMYFTAALCMWIDDKMQGEATDLAIHLGLKDEQGNDLDINGNIVDADGNIIQEAGTDNVISGFTQEEVDAKLAQAREEAAAEASAEVLNSLRTQITEGDSMLKVLRSFYPDDLIVASSGKYHFAPINRELKLNDLKQENLNILDTGEYQYMQDGQVTSHKGIDVSQYQGDIDWEAVAADGVEFAFVRVGYRGYGEAGKLMEDKKYAENIEGALKAGIKVGVYFYSQAITEAEAVEEANFVLERIAPYKIECPVVIDVEIVSGADGRMNKISNAERSHYASTFCETIAASGYKPMVYHNLEVGVVKLDLPELEQYDRWFASYSDTFYFPYEYKVWQYSESGSVNGIKGAVDMNICFAPIWE